MLLHTFQTLPPRSVVILGLGVENQQFLKWAVEVAEIPAETFVLADRTPLTPEKIRQMGFCLQEMGFDQNQEFFGDHYLESLKRKENLYVLKAPGIWSEAKYLQDFRETKGLDKVISPLHFFVERFKNQIIGVSGTKGKTTTAGLIAHLLNELIGYEGIYCGNSTNISPYTFWTTLDFKPPAETYFVIELSSFQLQDLGYSKLSPARAVLTNYFIDHLDQHASKEEYWHAKDNLYLHQEEPKLFVTEQLPEYVQNHARSVLTSNLTKTLLAHLRVPLLGQHNRTNLALALTVLADVSEDEIEEFVILERDKLQRGLDSFENLPYRYELVRQNSRSIVLAGTPKHFLLRFINDGAATEPEAVKASIKASTETSNAFLWVQFTGVDKGVDPSPIITEILKIQAKNQLYRADYCGQIGQKILQTIYQKMKVPITVSPENFRQIIESDFVSLTQITKDFERWLNELHANLVSIEATEQLAVLENHSDYILNVVLSPGGSSFDEFKNYIERSNFWSTKVETLS